MSWWVYKCNNSQKNSQRAHGDWNVFFDGSERRWGNTEQTPPLAKLKPGHKIIAYQTDRNELVGLAEVVGLKKRGSYQELYLRPLKTIRSKIRPLKEKDPRIAAMPAFQQGPVMTVYPISDGDAHHLLVAAGAAKDSTPTSQPDGGDVDEERHFIEGERRVFTGTVRNAGLRMAAKRKWGVKCCCCGFLFEDFYGPMAAGCGIVHHLELFIAAKGKRRVATVEDVRVVCANCHYILHKDKTPMDIQDLKKWISKRWQPWTHRGLKRNR